VEESTQIPAHHRDRKRLEVTIIIEDSGNAALACVAS
jgi:hypothetical protein